MAVLSPNVIAWFVAVAALCARIAAPAAANGKEPRKPLKTERRCGWIVNPTPGNWAFIDRHGQWRIAIQGEDGALGGLPEDRPAGRKWWVETNSGGYGYGCMCLDVQVDKRSMTFVKITGGKSLLIKTCRMDRVIKKVEPPRAAE